MPRARIVALVLLLVTLLAAAPAVGAPRKAPARPTTTVPPKPTLAWQLGPAGWVATGPVPACPAPLRLALPVDLAKVTSVLYPGQTRGSYKPHGGFRFDTTANDAIQVRAPLAGFVVRGARYLVEGEVQYTFDVVHPCGIMFRVGHLLAVPKELQAVASRFPAPTTDSRTSWVRPPVPVTAGQLLATSVGIKGTKNAFVDFGVYDLRRANAASRNPAWQAAHADDRELAWHALCWLDLLPTDVAARLRALPPGDPTAGRRSDFCGGG